MIRAVAGGALVLAALALSPAPLLAQSLDLDACVAEAERVIGIAARPVARAFLLERESAVRTEALARGGCVAYLAIGGRGLRDVDLLTHTTEGLVLEEDVEPRGWAWARACGEAGLEVAVIAHAFAGRGEVRVVAFDEGPQVPPALDVAIGECFARAAGSALPIADLGALAPMRALDVALAESERDAAARGWAPIERVVRGTLAPGAIDAGRIAAREGHCYRIDALAGPELRDLTLEVIAPDGAAVAEDRGRARDARVSFCARADGGHLVRAQATSGTGTFAVRTYDLAQGWLEGVVDPRARIETAELRARGLAPTEIAWGLADRGGPQRFAIRAAPGCTAIAALRSSEIEGADLDLRIEDEHGRLRAWDVGPASPSRGAIPIAWTCGEAERDVAIVVSSDDAAGRFLVVAAPGDG